MVGGPWPKPFRDTYVPNTSCKMHGRIRIIPLLVLSLVMGGPLGCDSGGSGGNEPPLAAFSYAPEAPTAGEKVTFTDESEDPDGEVTERSWDLGTGDTRTGVSVDYVYQSAGDYDVELKVTDASGSSDSRTQTIEVGVDAQTYRNPVVTPVAADPSIIRDSDGTYYLYATQDDWGDGDGFHHIPIFRSDDLFNWTYVGDVFPGIPDWGGQYNGQFLWAPDISKRDGTYYLYYSYVQDGGPSCIGLATADNPDGLWEDHGEPIFCDDDIGVTSSIDPYVQNENPNPTIIWGSFHGIYAVKLNQEGTSAVGEKIQVADDRFEGAYVHEHNGQKYLFLSAGTCCEGAQSTYEVYVGRSDSLTGPYVGPGGTDLRNGGGLRILSEGNGWVGPGHNSVATDDAGTDWLVYHAIPENNPRLPSGANRRPVLIDSINWNGGWPEVNGGSPSGSPRPVPTIDGE